MHRGVTLDTLALSYKPKMNQQFLTQSLGGTQNRGARGGSSHLEQEIIFSPS